MNVISVQVPATAGATALPEITREGALAARALSLTLIGSALALFGGVDLVVPEGWRVALGGTPSSAAARTNRDDEDSRARLWSPSRGVRPCCSSERPGRQIDPSRPVVELEIEVHRGVDQR